MVEELYGLTEWFCSLIKGFCQTVEGFYQMEKCSRRAVGTFCGADYSPLLTAEWRIRGMANKTNNDELLIFTK